MTGSVPYCFVWREVPGVFRTPAPPSVVWRSCHAPVLQAVSDVILDCCENMIGIETKNRIHLNLLSSCFLQQSLTPTATYCTACSHTLLVRFLRPPIRAEEQFRYFVGNVYAVIWFISGINKTYICIILVVFLFCFSLPWFDWIGSKRRRSMIDWLNDWLIDCFIDSLIGWLIQLRGPYERETQPIKVRVAYKNNNNSGHFYTDKGVHKGVHTALYNINNNVYIKTSIFKNYIVIILYSLHTTSAHT